jgi:hypothetical protein
MSNLRHMKWSNVGLVVIVVLAIDFFGIRMIEYRQLDIGAGAVLIASAAAFLGAALAVTPRPDRANNVDK